MATSRVLTVRDSRSSEGHNQPCTAWGRDFLLPSIRNPQERAARARAVAYLQSGSAGSCRQPGDPAILHNLHLRQAAPSRSRLRKVTQDASSRLNYSAALPRGGKGGKKTTRASYLRSWRGRLASPSSQNNEVSGIRAPACAATSSTRDGGLAAGKGLRGEGDKPEAHKARIKGRPFISAPDGPAAEMQEGGRDNRGRRAAAERGLPGPPERRRAAGPCSGHHFVQIYCWPFCVVSSPPE